MNTKTALIILDGWGIGAKDSSNAIFSAKTPFFDGLVKSNPNAQLRTDGTYVGLPEGQMGNSEVGHLNIGAGRVVYQDLEKINVAIRSGELERNETLHKAFELVKERGCKLHLLGLVGTGGVHAHSQHLIALVKMAAKHGVAKQVCLHGFSDGRDTDPNSGLNFFSEIELALADLNVRFSSIIGRYYAMDRDKRWERVKQAYDLLVNGLGEAYTDTQSVFEKNYAQGISDEFIPASIIQAANCIKENDVVVCYNFRTDRCRELSEVLTQNDMPDFGMKTIATHYITLTNYDKSYKGVHVVFDKDNIEETLGETLAKNGKTQLRIAETEKYPHVTFFFSGGREAPFDGERRIMANSPKVATYDLQPEMSAMEIANSACEDIRINAPDFICLNFANPDMVGHTGVYEAVVKAVEFTDSCCEKVVNAALQAQYNVVVIADHGNADFALNPDGSANTAHSTNPVPILVISPKVQSLNNGKLADVAPTILKLMQIPQPIEMTGEALF